MLGEYCDINILDTEDGSTHSLSVSKEYDGKDIKKLTVQIPGSEDIVWENTYKGLSEQQIATAHMFEEMLVKEAIIYTPGDAIQDMAIAYSE